MLYTILRHTIAPLTKILFRIKVIGKENLPKKGAYILASNHNDNSDPVVLAALTHRKICFLGHHHLVNPPNKIRLILKHIKKELILIEKGKGKSQQAIDLAVERLNQGYLFGIFPEGSTKGKEKLLPPHRGVARIALKAKVPVIPIAIIGNAHVYEGQRVLPKRIPKVTVNIGSPLYFEKYYGKENDRKLTKQVADKVMAEIRRLYYQYHR
ncbi:MAG TPA: lysophospholipid acyltransferase family protein [Candidatus Nanoarchaeia archaeon]|nr:lysophospholipid acyltransferase family protein [Candidatus Nanoarchaeia archaeon]